MSMKFTLTINTDNPCIGHGRNAARALERVARDLDEIYPMEDGLLSKRGNRTGVVRAIDGSIVGTWEIDN